MVSWFNLGLGMIKRQIGQLPYYQFEHLAEFPQLTHAVFTREGGVSKAPFDWLNVAFGVGDQKEAVAENRRRIMEGLAISPPVYCQQTHGDGIVIADPEMCVTTPKGDVLVTDHFGLFLAIQVADCQSVMLYDPKSGIVANIHSGWRGSVRNIIGKTVLQMQRLGSRPKNIIAGVGPSLGPCCAEFINYRKELPEAIHSYQRSENHFDFWHLSFDQLTGQGVLGGHIEQSRICTCCNSLFFSYRREKRTGRFATVIGLRKQ